MAGMRVCVMILPYESGNVTSSITFGQVSKAACKLPVDRFLNAIATASILEWILFKTSQCSSRLAMMNRMWSDARGRVSTKSDGG